MRASLPRPAAECRPTLHGTFDQVGLATLLTMLDMERSSGLLLVRRSGEVGRLWLRNGRVVRARTDGRTERTGKRAVYHILTWSQARFELSRDEVMGADEIGTSTPHLLMQAAQRMDEALSAAASPD